MASRKVYNLLGLSQRASRLVSGEFMTEKAVKDGSATLVIVASDASANTKKLFGNICHTHKIEYMEYGTKEDLGRALGKEIRASVAVIDEGFTGSIKKAYNEEISVH